MVAEELMNLRLQINEPSYDHQFLFDKAFINIEDIKSILHADLEMLRLHLVFILHHLRLDIPLYALPLPTVGNPSYTWHISFPKPDTYLLYDPNIH